MGSSARSGHLIRRFVGSLWPAGPSTADAAWAEDRLLPGERDLWRRMSRADRRHAVAVAREVERRLGSPPRPVLAAALLHDVGKLVSGLGTYGRVVATLSGAAAGRETASQWSASRGFTRRVGLYLQHPDLGADLLRLAGSDDLTIEWARQHHLPADGWTVDPVYAEALAAADDD